MPSGWAKDSSRRRLSCNRPKQSSTRLRRSARRRWLTSAWSRRRVSVIPILERPGAAAHAPVVRPSKDNMPNPNKGRNIIRTSRSSFVVVIGLRRTTSPPRTESWAIPGALFIGGDEPPVQITVTVMRGWKLATALQYGIGTRRNATAAIKAYRRAIASDHTTDYAREEAQYHLAIALINRGGWGSQREIERLLHAAAEDGDYPRAIALLVRVGEQQPLRICRCRRGLARRLGGKAHCPLHRNSRT